MDQKPISKQAFPERINRPEPGWGRLWAGQHVKPATTDERSQP